MVEKKSRSSDQSKGRKKYKHRTLHLGNIEYSLQDVNYATGENTYLNENPPEETE